MFRISKKNFYFSRILFFKKKNHFFQNLFKSKNEAPKENPSLGIKTTPTLSLSSIPKKPPSSYTPLPPFNILRDEDILEFTNYSFNLQLKSPFRWTPLIQLSPLSADFSAKMKAFSKRRFFKDENSSKELVETLLIEALKETEFDFYREYKCMASQKCPFHGNLPYIIFNKNHEFHLPLTPVILSKRTFSPLGQVFNDEWNLAEGIGAGIWALENMKAVDTKNEINFSRVLHTNGNLWRMYEFDNKGGFKKTGFYIPKSRFENIYEDPQMQSIVLGMIKFAIGFEGEKEKELRNFYEYLDERKYFERVDSETKRITANREKFYWKFVPRKIRSFFFKE